MGECLTTVLLLLLGFVLADVMGALIWVINRWAIGLIAATIHLYTITTASSHSIIGAVVTMFTPGLSQVYWIGSEWATKGTFWHPLTYMCAAGLVSLSIELVGRRAFADLIAAGNTRQS
jgi:hypothetical protein